MTPRKKKVIEDINDLPEEAKKRAGDVFDKPKPVSKPEFLQKRDGQSSTSPRFDGLFDDEITVEILELPSRGVLYNWKSGEIKLRPYQTSEQKIISTINKGNFNSIITKLMNACIIEPSPREFPVTEYTAGDAVSILFWLRANSYSPIYSYTGVSCGECGKKNVKPIDYDLTNVEFKYLDEDISEPIEIKLNDRVTIFISVYRRRHEIEGEKFIKWLEKIKSESPGDEWLQKYVTCIDEIMIDGELYEGNLDGITKMKFLENVPSKHLQKIDEAQEKFIHGIKPIVEHVCPYCGTISERILPITQDFFFQGV